MPTGGPDHGHGALLIIAALAISTVCGAIMGFAIHAMFQ